MAHLAWLELNPEEKSVHVQKLDCGGRLDGYILLHLYQNKSTVFQYFYMKLKSSSYSRFFVKLMKVHMQIT